MLRILIALLLLAGSAPLVACGGDDDDDAATPSPTEAAASEAATPTSVATETDEPDPTQAATTDVAVTLSEYEIVLDAESGPAGEYAFAITNEGTEEQHVFMIVQTDLDADALPVESTGKFVPSNDATILANTPGMNIGSTDTMVYPLEAGNYVFICNQVSPGIADGPGQGHYAQGMRIGFTVE